MNATAIRRREYSPGGCRWPTGAAIVLILTLLSAGAISPAWAHPVQPQRPAAADGVDRVAPPEAAQPPIVPATPPSDVTACAMALTTLGVIVLIPLVRRRRPLALALAVIAVTFAFESGIHSVHHLDSPSKAAHCAVAAAGMHNPGLVGETALVLVAPGDWDIDSPVAPGAEPVSGVHRPFHSRAPPALLART